MTARPSPCREKSCLPRLSGLIPYRGRCVEPHPRMDGFSMCARSPPCPSIWGAGNKPGGVSLAGRAVVCYETSIGVLPQRWDCRSVEQPLHLDVAGVWEDGIKRTGHRSLLAHRLGKDASPCGFVPPGTAVPLLFLTLFRFVG